VRTPGDRVVSLDVLRGFALLGILVMNIQSFSMPEAAYLNPSAYGDLSGANFWVWAAGRLLADEKMYGLFSILFGAGIVLMTSRIEQEGGRSGALHYRRMGWLLLFGLLHAHLLWYGDILYTYALCGMFVYLLRRKTPRALIIWALVFYVLGTAIGLGIGASMASWPAAELEAFTVENWRPSPQMIQEEVTTFRGGWLTQLPARIEQAIAMETIIFLVVGAWKTIGNMLLGMALLKMGVLSGEAARAVYVRMAIAGFALGLPIVAFGIWRNVDNGWPVTALFVTTQFNYWGAIIADFGWIGALMLLYLSPGAARIKATLAATGRMAFSNYILQTLICTTLFYGHGFGLFGTVSRVQQITIVVLIWIVQLVISPLWLSRFAYGPLEWVWRSLTYWRRIPLSGGVAERAPAS
jgi:uncharacterized protein